MAGRRNRHTSLVPAYVCNLMQPNAGVNNQPSKYRNLATAKSEKQVRRLSWHVYRFYKWGFPRVSNHGLPFGRQNSLPLNQLGLTREIYQSLYSVLAGRLFLIWVGYNTRILTTNISTDTFPISTHITVLTRLNKRSQSRWLGLAPLQAGRGCEAGRSGERNWGGSQDRAARSGHIYPTSCARSGRQTPAEVQSG